MIASNHNSSCRQAELYYYDLLCDDGWKRVQKSVSDHIDVCQHCQEGITQLKQALSRSKSNIAVEGGQLRAALGKTLQLHFSYIGKHVTCNIVRPFLPSLLDVALEIKIPTPITAHLANCTECQEDLETIRRLNLAPDQLNRLSMLLMERPIESGVSCSGFRLALPKIAAIDWATVPAETFRHLSKCSACRRQLNLKRQDILDSLFEPIQLVDFPCESVQMTDVFDYCFPLATDASDYQSSTLKKPLAKHLGSCRTCLAKMQALYETISAIAERPESEVFTLYTIDKSAKTEARSEIDDLYAGFPIRVDVLPHQGGTEAKPSVTMIDFIAGLKRKFASINLKKLPRTAVAVAAVVLVVSVLLFNVPTAKAVTIEQIYKAIEKVTNVHISSFVPDSSEPIQEIWLSHALNVRIQRTEKQVVLFDVANKDRKIKDLRTGSIQTTPMSEDLLAKVQNSMVSSLGIMPFFDIIDVPEGAQWNRVQNEDVENIVSGTEVYDLTWAKTNELTTEYRKWRVFVDVGTSLPKRTEHYYRPTTEDEYILESIKAVTYPTDSELETFVQTVFD